MKFTAICFLLFMLCDVLFAQQNLVPNSGFEDITDASVCGTICPSCGNGPGSTNWGVYDDQLSYWNKINNWTIPDKKFCGACIGAGISCCVGSPDIFCNDPTTAHTGNSCVRQVGGGHEYITVQLSSPLKPYFNYHVEFFIFINSTENMGNFGIHFSEDRLKQCEGHVIEVTPQIEVGTIPTRQWVLVSGTNTPINADDWITIGSFNAGESPFAYFPYYTGANVSVGIFYRPIDTTSWFEKRNSQTIT